MGTPFRIYSSLADHPSVLARMGNDNITAEASLPEPERTYSSQLLYSNWASVALSPSWENVGYFLFDMIESKRCWRNQYEDVNPIEAPVFHVGDRVYTWNIWVSVLGTVVSKRLKLIGNPTPSWKWVYKIEWETPFPQTEFTSEDNPPLQKYFSDGYDPRPIQERLRERLGG